MLSPVHEEGDVITCRYPLTIGLKKYLTVTDNERGYSANIFYNKYGKILTIRHCIHMGLHNTEDWNIGRS